MKTVTLSSIKANRVFLRVAVSLLLLGWVILLCGGCAHYRWGSPREVLPFRTLYVKPVANKTYVPQAQVLLSTHIIHELQQSGVSIVSCEEEADATLEVSMVEYSRSMATTQASDTFVANAFEVELVSEVSLEDNRSGEVYIRNRRVEATINALTDEGLQAIEYQDMPVLTRKLAKKIKDLVMSPW